MKFEKVFRGDVNETPRKLVKYIHKMTKMCIQKM